MRNCSHSLKTAMVGTALAALLTLCEAAFGQQEPSAQQQPSIDSLQEVTVTATRHNETQQDYAGSIQVVSSEDLAQSGKDGLESYVFNLPSVSFQSENGVTHVTMRGISNIGGGDFGSSATAETVGVYINDVPLSGTSVLPNLDMYDVQRVEVLEGPQGTLYGAGAMGGAIRIILNQPSTAGVEGSADETLSGTDSGGVNERVRGAVNVPLSSTVALRMAGTYTEDSGYITNLATGQPRDNGSTDQSMRALLSAQLTDRFSAELMFLNETSHQNQADDVDNISTMTIDSPEPRYSDVSTQIEALTLHYDLGWADLTSVSSYFDSAQQRLMHLVFASLLTGEYGVPVSQNNYQFNTVTTSKTQELRLVSKGDDRLKWVLGAFYEDRQHNANGTVPLAPADLIALNTVLFSEGLPTFGTPAIWDTQSIKDYTIQTSGYLDGSYALTSSLDLLAGVRVYRQSLEGYQYQHGLGVFLSPTNVPVSSSAVDSGAIPKFGLRYKLSKDVSVYGLISQGFRASAPNLGYGDYGLGAPEAHSDRTTTYELGAKTEWAEGRLIANASVYHVDWTDMQISETGIADKVPYIGMLESYLSNVGKSEIDGAELSVAAIPVQHVQLGANLGFNDGRFTNVPPSAAIEGSPLPHDPRWTGSAYAEYRMPLFSNKYGYARFEQQYTGSQLSVPETAAIPDGYPLRSYALSNVRVGLNSESWGIEAFVENLTNKRAELGRGVESSGGGLFDVDRFSIIRPLTAGVRVSTQF
jgi:iron complex outermembrane recepter protein